MKTHPRRGKAAFTLIELMAVITIIVILAGLVVGGLGYVQEKQARSRAQVQIQLLSKALEEYKLDMGMYPPAANSVGAGNSAQSLYVPLFYEGYSYKTQSTPPANWTKTVSGVTIPKATTIYLTDLDPTTTKQGWVVSVIPPAVPPSATTVTDPWGQEYQYRTGMSADGKTPNTNAMNPDFDLWSMGKNGVTDPVGQLKDDIRNY